MPSAACASASPCAAAIVYRRAASSTKSPRSRMKASNDCDGAWPALAGARSTDMAVATSPVLYACRPRRCSSSGAATAAASARHCSTPAHHHLVAWTTPAPPEPHVPGAEGSDFHAKRLRADAACGPLRSSWVCLARDRHGRRSTAVPAFSGPRSRATTEARGPASSSTPPVPCPRAGRPRMGPAPAGTTAALPAPAVACRRRRPRWCLGQVVRVCGRRPHSRSPRRWQAQAGVDEVMRSGSQWSPASEGRRTHTRTACQCASRCGHS